MSKSSLAVGAALIDIENYARGNREVENISQEARKGTISYAEAIERLNKIKLPTDLYENSRNKQRSTMRILLKRIYLLRN